MEINRKMHPEQERILKSMKPEDKLKIAQQLYFSAKKLKAAGLRIQHPEWDDGKILNKVREIFLYGKT